MGSVGPFEIMVIFLIILLVFGAKRIPEIARGLGKGIREFKTATKELSQEFNVEEPVNRIQPPAQPPHGNPAPRTADPLPAPSQSADPASSTNTGTQP